jgi:hypothetical protein
MLSTYAQNVMLGYHITRVTSPERIAGRVYGHGMDEVANATAGTRHVPAPIIAIHVLAAVGVLFWLSMIVTAVNGGSSSPAAVIVLGVVLGGAHVAISWLTHRRSRLVYAAMVFVLVSDAGLTLVVDRRAILLVLFTLVLLLLTRAPSAQRWFAAPG